MTFLGNLIVLDVEGKFFQATIDGINKKAYTFNQILDCQHLKDHPGYNVACEGAHFNPKPKSKMDRGAQPFELDQINRHYDDVMGYGVTHFSLPAQLAKRVMYDMDCKPEDACLAWYRLAATKPKIVDMVSRLKPITEKTKIRNLRLNQSRADSCQRIDALASLGYPSDHPEMVNCRSMLQLAATAGRISPELAQEFDIKIKKNGEVSFKKRQVWVMSLYVTACDADGKFRCDITGNPIGIRKVLSGIGAHHAHKGGKGSMASARARSRKHLRKREEEYRVAHGIDKKGKQFPDAIPEVRKHHEQMNKELVRIFRDFSSR